MKLKGKFTADVHQLTTKANKSHDGRATFVDLDIAVDHDDAEKKWGQGFATLAFSTMRAVKAEQEGEEDTTAFLVDHVKPNARFVFEMHRISLEDETIDVQPRLMDIRTVEKSKRVVATLRLQIDVGREKLISALNGKVGDTTKLEFNPKQGQLFDLNKSREAAE
jgi:hypothetical protein